MDSTRRDMEILGMPVRRGPPLGPDILMGTTYQSQSQLRLSDGQGGWTDATASNLPQVELSVGDLELGDVDGDGDLDVVLADWGDTSPMVGAGLVQLWLNDGNALFTDATAARMPDTPVGFSWDLELVDVDNDWDLDVAVSCKTCSSSLPYLNDGAGTFTDVSGDRMPAFTNNYGFAPVDLDGDGFLDLVTINDGTPGPNGLRERIFRNDGTGSFQDVTEDWWPNERTQAGTTTSWWPSTSTPTETPTSWWNETCSEDRL
jgi:hypothetical protein